MNKNFGVLTASMAIMLFIAPAVMAESLDLQVSTGQQPSNRISTCPDTVLSDIDLMLTNLGGQTDTIELSLDWPADMGFIKPFITLSSGESQKVNPFWITVSYNLEPGIYHAKVNAESSMTGDVVSEDIEIEVMQCHSVYIIADDDYGQSCSESGEPVIYDLEIGNQGKWSETFELSASVEWAEFSEDEVTIGAQNSRTVSLVLSPPVGTSSGLHTVFVTAKSTESYATDSASVEMEVVDCFEFEADLDPESQSACVGETRDFDLIITNTGEQEDEFTITVVPDWVFPDRESVELQGGESETILLTAAHDEEGIQSFDVVVESQRDSAAESVTLSGMLDVNECRGVAIIVTPSDEDACKGETVEFSVSVKNTGSIQETYDLESTFGVLDTESIELDGGKSGTVILTVDTAELPEGSVVIDITASDGSIVDTASVELDVENCFSAELSVQPDEVTVCPGASIPYTIKVENTGKEADEYTISFADQERFMSLEAGESEVTSYDFEIPYIEEGRYLFSVELASEGGIDLLETSEINMRSSDTCYGVELEDDMGVVEVGRATTVEIAIMNTGEQAENFMVEVESGPEWAFLQPSEIHIDGGEEDVIYLYLSPGFGTALETYMVSIRAYSDHAEDTLDVTVIVPEDITDVPVEPEEPTEPEEPEEPAGNITINVTHPEEPPVNGTPITGGAVEERPFWKTAAVALIALIIVAILVLRFVLLLKK